MSEASTSLAASTGHDKLGPDYFGYYTREITELLSQDEDFLPITVKTFEFTGRKCGEVTGKDTIDGGGTGADSSFSNGIGAGLSDFKKERLKSLLRQGVFHLTPEVDEMLDPVIAMCQLQSQIRQRKSLSSDIGAASKGRAEGIPCKKLKTSSSFSSTSIPPHASPPNSGSCREVDDDLQFLLDNNSLLVEETMKKYSDELSATLGHMERQLEELLNAVAAKCRPMTLTEKQELRKLIQKLPPNNLDRVVEIVQHNKLAENQSCDEVFVDLEKEDNVTLWRVYYYVKAVEKARELLYS